MKVLMLSGDISAIKGEQGPFYTTLQGLSQYWEKIDVICPWSNGSPEQKQLFDNVCLWSRTVSKLKAAFSFSSIYADILNFSEYDLIVSHDYGFMLNGIAAHRLSRQFQIPYISEIHHIEGYPIAANLKDYLYRFAGKIYLNTIARNAIGIRIVNDHQMRPLLNKLGYDNQKIHYIPSMYIDFDVFKPMNLPIEYDAFFCGRLVANKGIFQILEAVKEIKKSKADYKLLIKGQGPLEQEIKDFTEKNDLQNNVTLIKWVDTPQDLAKLYNQSQVLICSSTAEGGPRVTLEAMACQIPVISTPVGLMPEIIENGCNGFLYNWDQSELIGYLKKFINSENNFTPLAKAGRESIQHFEKNLTLKNYAESYRAILKGNSL
jgi:colanic acid/amylovoran biosynthesis glycosyltransferase